MSNTATGMPPFVCYTTSSGSQQAGFQMEGSNILIQHDGCRTIESSYTLVTNYGINVHQDSMRRAEDMMRNCRESIINLEAQIREQVRNTKKYGKQMMGLNEVVAVPSNTPIQGVLAWGVHHDECIFYTKMIIASDVTGSFDDIVVGALRVTFSVGGNYSIGVTNYNRTVTGYRGAHTPHPHHTSGGICLGGYAVPFEGAISNGFVIEAIEQLMLHFTSFNSADDAGSTAARWVMDEDEMAEVTSKYETITHGELL